MFYRSRKAFDRIKRVNICEILKKKSILVRMIYFIKVYKDNRNVIRIKNEESTSFQINLGLNYGCVAFFSSDR